MSLLGIDIIFILKAHYKIIGRGVEYILNIAKTEFRIENNNLDVIRHTENLGERVEKYVR